MRRVSFVSSITKKMAAALVYRRLAARVRAGTTQRASWFLRILPFDLLSRRCCVFDIKSSERSGFLIPADCLFLSESLSRSYTFFFQGPLGPRKSSSPTFPFPDRFPPTVSGIALFSLPAMYKRLPAKFPSRQLWCSFYRVL